MAFLLMHASRRIMHSFEYVFPSFPHTGLAIRGHGMLHSNETSIVRSSHSKMFLRKGVLKIYSKLTGEHPCRSAISIKLQSNFIESTLRHGCSPVNLLHIFRTPFPKNTPGRLFLIIAEILFRFFEQFLKSQIIVIYTFKMYFSV